MNILNIIDEIEKVDGEIYERLSPRRSAMKDFFNTGAKIALAAMPLALGSVFKKAYGQTTPSGVLDVLNYALTLEYLEYHFYNHAISVNGLIPSGPPNGAITTIRDHEKAHVDLLAGAITANGGTPVSFTYNQFDFTAKGTFPTVYSNYQTFLAVAQAFEDTGVRAYKGQATALKGMPVLTTALQIHSVEARHAAHIRYMRSANGATIKPWISLGVGGVANDTGIAAVDPIYAGENLEEQAGINITGIAIGVTKAAAVESFDEPLAKADVLTIAGLFIK